MRRYTEDDLRTVFVEHSEGGHVRPPRLEEIVRQGHAVRLRRRVATGAALVGIAAAAVVIPGALSDGTTGKPPSVAQRPERADAGHLAARTFLLAAATTTMKEPAEMGTYWHANITTVEAIRWSKEADENTTELITEFSEKAGKLSGDLDKLKTLGEGYRQKIQKVIEEGRLPFAASKTASNEAWIARDHNKTSRVTVSPEKITFASPADEKKWKEMGSPALSAVATKPQTFTLRDVSPYGAVFGGEEALPADELEQGMPTDKAGLERWLHEKYEKKTEDDKKLDPATRVLWPAPQESYGEWMFWVSKNLLAAPLEPGTRAALFQLLAEQPGVTSPGKATDSLGRTGVALTMTRTDQSDMRASHEQVELRLIIDEKTGELLSSDTRPVGRSTPTFLEIHERIGWVDKIGDVPEN